MDKAENLSRKRSLFASAAVLAPMTQAASGQGWPAVVGIAVAAWLMSRWCGYGSGWVLAVQKVWCCVLVSVVMKWSTYFWTGLPFCGVVPLILLVLGAWAASVPGKAQRIGCVLLWLLLLLLGAVLLSAVSEVKLSYLRPVWEVPDLTLLAILLLPALGRKERGNWKMPAAAVLVSIATTGVLTVGVSMASHSGIYELSRSLSLLGIAERFESLVAAAMTMGFFAGITYLLESSGENNGSVWIYAGISAALYLTGVLQNGWILGLGSVLVWIVLPRISCRK